MKTSQDSKAFRKRSRGTFYTVKVSLFITKIYLYNTDPLKRHFNLYLKPFSFLWWNFQYIWIGVFSLYCENKPLNCNNPEYWDIHALANTVDADQCRPWWVTTRRLIRVYSVYHTSSGVLELFKFKENGDCTKQMHRAYKIKLCIIVILCLMYIFYNCLFWSDLHLLLYLFNVNKYLSYCLSNIFFNP